MPTNKQRRATAKRKLDRQLDRRAQQARRRRLYGFVGGAVAVLAVIAAIVATVLVVKNDPDAKLASTPTTSSKLPEDPPPAAPVYDKKLPPFRPTASLGANCTYPAAAAASKPVKPPRTGKVPTDPATVSVSVTTSAGNIGLQLDNAKAPCTVNSFASLAQQGFFNDTPCHRLTSTAGLSVLQCGDPSGAGSGGPGYNFADEYPSTEYPPGDADVSRPVVYPRGTLAMANSGPNSNGSQFFLVYQDSELPPNYTVFGTIDPTGLATLDKIAKVGTKGAISDGPPATPVKITSVQLDP